MQAPVEMLPLEDAPTQDELASGTRVNINTGECTKSGGMVEFVDSQSSHASPVEKNN